MDLARLAFVSTDLSGVGPVVIDAGSGNFEDWVRGGFNQKRWDSGQAFVRSLLAERARAPVAETEDLEGAPLALETGAAATIPSEGIEDFATKFLEGAKGFLTPRLERDGRGKVVRRAPDAATVLLQAVEGETAADRLIRVLKLRLEDTDLRVEREAARLGQLVSPILAATRGLTGLEGIAASRKLIGSDLRSLFGAEHFRTQVGALSAATDAVRLASRGLTPPFTVGVLADLSSLAARNSTLLDIALPARHLESVASAMEIARGVSQNRVWARDINSMLGLGLSDTVLATVRGMDIARAVDAARVSYAAAGLLRPGWLYTSEVVLAGLGPASAGAAVLTHYDVALPAGVLLGEALDSLHTLDADKLTNAEYTDRLAELVERGLSLWPTLDNVGRNGIIALIALLVAVLSVGIDLYDQIDDSDERAAAEAVATTNSELGRIRRLAEENREEAKAAKDYRRLSQKTYLRIEPTSGAQKIRLVFPDEIFRVIGADTEWVKVEVHDYGSDGVMIGWLPRSRITVLH